MRANRFDGKAVLIAGGASGLGAATAEAFVREGARVVIGDIQDERGEALAKGLRDRGGQASYIHADCTNADEVMSLVTQAAEHLGRLDIAANVLGGAAPDDLPGSSIHDTKPETLQRTMAISFTSIFLLMQQEVTQMMKQDRKSTRLNSSN